MKNIIILFIVIFPVCQSFAQTQPRAERFRSTEETIQIEEKTSFNFQYLMDQFTDGVIYFDTISEIHAKVNYNILLNVIQYFDEDENLQTLTYEHELDSIRIGRHLLVPFSRGFAELITTPEGSLIHHRFIRHLAETLVQGAYGSTDRTAKTERVTNLAGIADAGRGGGFNNDFLVPNRTGDIIEVSMRYFEVFYFPRGTELVELKNRRSTVNAFPSHQREVNNFIRKNNIDFESVASVMKLADFLHTLD